MIFDLQSAPPRSDRFDICIMGAGPAGITLAKKMAEHGRSVLLLEAGGLEYSQESQDIYKCQSSGRQAWPELTRLRYLGGTSNHWAGRCRPLTGHDFTEDYYGELPGWPIRYSEIAPYLDEASSILDLPESGFASISAGISGDNFSSDKFTHSKPTRFGRKYRSFLERSENIHLYINANAVELKQKIPSVIESVEVVNYKADRYSFSADSYVVAMGGIENARFLLNQGGYAGKGIGNQGEMLGKCFMEHLNIKLGEFVLQDSEGEGIYQYYTRDRFVKERKIGKANISFSKLEKIKSYGRTAEIKTLFKQLACDIGIEDKIQILTEFDCPGTGVIRTMIEQVAGEHSFVKLLDERDAIGLKKADFHWELVQKDLDTIKTVALEVANAFAESGLGIVKLENEVLNASPSMQVGAHAHHMGTTRMSDSPQFGVVDKNCKIHGVNNIYVAGSSIFSAGCGASNPTMPIVQFTLRLAEHLLVQS